MAFSPLPRKDALRGTGEAGVVPAGRDEEQHVFVHSSMDRELITVGGLFQ